MLEAFVNIKTRRVIPEDTNGIFHRSCLSSQCEYYEKKFEQRSELQIAKYLIVHGLSSRYNVSRLELRNKRKATQQWSLCVANDIVLNQVGVNNETVYADDVVSKFWFVRTFFSQHYPKFITNITSEKSVPDLY